MSMALGRVFSIANKPPTTVPVPKAQMLRKDLKTLDSRRIIIIRSIIIFFSTILYSGLTSRPQSLRKEDTPRLDLFLAMSRLNSNLSITI